MLRNQVAQTLKEYFEYYHLSDWKGIIENRSTRRFGSCSSNQKVIKISARLAELNPDWVINRTIKHEIAHALAGSMHKHDRFWKSICLGIGGDGRTTFDDKNTNTIHKKYTLPMLPPFRQPVINNPKVKIYTWVNKKGQKITVTERYS